ncbi:MAG TPA: hypothetical protein VN802_19395 [Stellaceae bacterium]|nr:hypothetical protein [Stellaceae bacterium]
MRMRFVWAMAALPLAIGAVSHSAHAQEAAKLFFEGDMARGPQPGLAPCVMTSQFHRKETVVFRIRVVDPDGKALDDKGLKSLVVELSNGQSLPMRYHRHPPPPAEITDFFWVVPWSIPEDFPTGSLTYKVVATDLAGKVATWQPFKIATSQLTVIADASPPAK